MNSQSTSTARPTTRSGSRQARREQRDRVHRAFAEEWRLAAQARDNGDPDRAFVHLERAHILGQRVTALHVRSHVGMLSLGWSRGDRREIVGQLVRIVAAVLFSHLWVPDGNTGRADVSALQPMPVPEELARVLRGEGEKNEETR